MAELPELHSDDTRERLLAAGLALFGRHGYDGVTTRMLAAAARVNQSAIPYHFGGKEGVYRAVAEFIAAEMAAPHPEPDPGGGTTPAGPGHRPGRAAGAGGA